MSSLPADDRNRPAGPDLTELGWQVRTGLTMIEAENLLDQLEARGITCRELRCEAAGVTVRWRPSWPRLARD
jgi:hypothetical protein